MRCLWILFIIITTVYVPAWLLLGLWFVSQFFIPGEGVAWMAHVGGFVVGVRAGAAVRDAPAAAAARQLPAAVAARALEHDAR